MKWSKLVANLVGNATAAIVGRPPSDVFADARGYEVERRQVREAIAVMPPERPARRRAARAPTSVSSTSRRACRRRSPGRSSPGSSAAHGAARAPSLLLTAQSGADRSEVEWLNGAVARAAADLGGAAPVNRRLAELVDEVLTDDERRAWFDGRVDRLAAEVGVTG